MRHRCLQIVLAAWIVVLAGCATSTTTPEPRAQLFEDMGTHRRTVTTSSPTAQRYFDQGLTWMYAFNHDEAIRSFTRAAELDPECAMAWWGVALCEGPNYNDPIMTDERSAAAWDALQKAQATARNATAVEQALIEALSHRYTNPWPDEDRSHLEKAYADAMENVWERFPQDSDVGTLYAEAMMVRRPWKLYDLHQNATGDTETIVTVLQHVMGTDPDNPGANHLYIHATEPSATPDRGLIAADRLSDLVPGSGHLRHMPAHIYVKTGRWERAIEQSEKAMSADTRYRRLSPHQGKQWIYMVHNSHMLAYAAMMTGREREAMAAARDMWSQVPDDALRNVGPFFDRWMCSVYDVQKRFGRWDDILAEPAPPEFLPITRATWRAHRAIAYAAKKDFTNAEREHELFRKAKARLPEDHKWGRDQAHRVLEVSDLFIAGEIALQKGDWSLAAELLEQSAAVEDTLGYGEPPQWLQPVRHTLGAVYLKAGRYDEAERVYREDLKKWRRNGWSLYGLSRALHAQGRVDEARRVEREYQTAWARADEPTRTSCKCIPST
jgi:tetratricopeptide (TPR) repeat protein